MSKRSKTIELPPKFVQRLNPLRPAAEQISSSLKMAILDMSLVPGQVISETEVGNLFGASRTPVREAFTWLRDQGLIVTYPSRGNYVSRLSIPKLKGAQFVRESLEVSIAERLCEDGLSPETIGEIEENLKFQQEFITSEQSSAFHELDDNFHVTLADAVGHSRISEIIQREKAGLDRLRVLSLSNTENLTSLLTDHREIYNAILSRDKVKARRSVRKHLRRVLDTLSVLFNEHRDYFDDY